MLQYLMPIIFSTIIWFMNYFVLKSVKYGILISTLIVIFVWVSMGLNQKKPSGFSRVLYFISMMSFAIFSQLFVYFLIADIFKIPRLYVFFLTLILTGYGYLNSRNIYVQKYDVGLGKRIVQLTDVHIGPANRENRVEKVIQITNKLKPDIVLITGDLADMSTKLDSHMFDSLKKIKAPKYMIHGNHEFYDGKKKIEEQLKTADIKILNDESVYIKDLTILGADYKSDPEIVINKTKIKGKSILMIHEPLGEKAAAKHKIDLVLSGHTHGGQFFPFTIFVNLFFKFTRGIHDYKGSKIIVSMGTLTWGPQVRIGSRNQIIVID